MLKKYLAPVIIGAVACAFFFPEYGIAIKDIIPYGLMILLYSGCLNFDIQQIKKLRKQKLLILITFSLLYFLGGFTLLIFRPFLTKELLAGFLIILTVPCGMASIYFTSVFNGDLPISLLVTTVSNLLAPIVIPLLYGFFAHYIFQLDGFDELKLDFLQVFLLVAKIVLIPFLLAIITQMLQWQQKARIVSKLGLPIMFLMTFGLVSPGVETMLNNFQLTAKLLFIVSIMVSFQFAVGYFLSKHEKLRISLAILLSYRNFTIASIIALQFFPIEAALPSLIFTVVNNLSLTIMPVIFSYAVREVKENQDL